MKFITEKLIILWICILLSPIHAMDGINLEQNNKCIINFMWVNKAVPLDQTYIFPDIRPHTSNDTPLRQTIDWLEAWYKGNPQCQLNFWYNQQSVTAEAIQNTQKLLIERELSDRIILRDVGEVSLVAQNPQIFNDPIPLYFRVDLLRAVIADALARSQRGGLIVYADLSIPPLKYEELFDPKTMDILEKYGLVLSKNANSSLREPFENGFFILNGTHAAMVDAHRKAIIDINIKRAQEALKIDEETGSYKGYRNSFSSNKIDKDAFAGMTQLVFESYYQLMKLYLVLQGDYKIIAPNDGCKAYKLQSHEHPNDPTYMMNCKGKDVYELQQWQAEDFLALNHPYFKHKILKTERRRAIYLEGKYFKDLETEKYRKLKIPNDVEEISLQVLVDIHDPAFLWNQIIKDVQQPKSRQYDRNK